MKAKILSAALVAATLAASAHAGAPLIISTPTSKSETKAYAGLNWSLNGGPVPAVVLGLFDTKVKSNGDTTGANLAFHINVAGGIKPGKLKLSYLNGDRNLQGELGAGYDFVKGEPLLGLGLNAPHVALGVDAYLKPSFVPYATLHSQGAFFKPEPLIQNLPN